MMNAKHDQMAILWANLLTFSFELEVEIKVHTDGSSTMQIVRLNEAHELAHK